MKKDQPKPSDQPKGDAQKTDNPQPSPASTTEKKRKNKPSTSVGKLLSGFLYRFHFVLFVVIVLGGTALVVLMVNNALIDASDTSSAITSTGASFDQQTIERLGELDDASTQSQLQIPPGRTNPFTE